MVFWGATRLPLIASRSVSGEVAQKLEDVAWHAKLKQQLASFQSEAKKNLKRDQNDSQTWKVEDKKDKKEKGRKELKSKSEKKRKKKRESSDEEALGHETEMVFNLTSFFFERRNCMALICFGNLKPRWSYFFLPFLLSLHHMLTLLRACRP
jgi:hypothetical protein